MIGRLFVLLTGLWLAVMLVIFSDAGSGIVGLFLFIGGVVALGGAVIVQVLQRRLARRGTVPPPRASGRWTLAAPIALTLALLMAASAGPHNPLFRLRFAMSQSAFEARARALGTAPFQSTQPEWIGWFRVERIVAGEGNVRFITTPCGVVDACGVVYAPSGFPKLWMEDRFTPLQGAWWHVFEGF